MVSWIKCCCKSYSAVSVKGASYVFICGVIKRFHLHTLSHRVIAENGKFWRVILFVINGEANEVGSGDRESPSDRTLRIPVFFPTTLCYST
jgi:hypothetical protein